MPRNFIKKKPRSRPKRLPRPFQQYPFEHTLKSRPKSIGKWKCRVFFEVLESVSVQVKGMKMVSEKVLRRCLVRETQMKKPKPSSGSPDEEAETQLRIWVLLDDRSDNVGRDMRE